jgi:hypothetical protein
MIDGRHIYETVKAGMLELSALRDETLRELLGHLGRKGKITGTAGQIWSEALAEAALRFMRAKKSAAGKRSEGTEALTDFVNTEPDTPDA